MISLSDYSERINHNILEIPHFESKRLADPFCSKSVK